MQFIDANIFLRYLTRDDEVKAQACRALFDKAQENNIALTTSESVIAEVVGYDGRLAAGSLAAARQQSLPRLEGKDYAVRDGDIMNIRFNV